jgi:hypothetical protein
MATIPDYDGQDGVGDPLTAASGRFADDLAALFEIHGETSADLGRIERVTGDAGASGLSAASHG